MIPAPSSGLAIVAVVWGVLPLVGLFAIVAAVNETDAPLVGRDLGCLVGGIVGSGWV